jgi:acetate kinase
MNVLVLNCGSSSVKFQVLETDLGKIEADGDRHIARGLIERVGSTTATLKLQLGDAKATTEPVEARDMEQALEAALGALTSGPAPALPDLKSIGAVGHRVVHGGEYFQKSTLVTPAALEKIEMCIDLAPLHNPVNLKGIRIARRLLPDIPHIAVFDTSYHQSMPAHAFLYALPYEQYTKNRARRYGFHGTSHRYMVHRLHRILDVPRSAVSAITCHFGNGCSICAVRDGTSIDTTMGFTPMEGLMMGTRAGDVDPGLLFHLMAHEEMAPHQLETMLNKHSGLAGISGLGNDMREIQREADRGNMRARLAIRMFCYRAAKAIGAFMTVVGKDLQAIAFAGGIGENAASVREQIGTQLEALGVEIDPLKNDVHGAEREIGSHRSRIRVFVIPTDEELVIARDAVRVLEGVL